MLIDKLTMGQYLYNSGSGIKLGGSPAANPWEWEKARGAKIDKSIEPTLTPITKMLDIL